MRIPQRLKPTLKRIYRSFPAVRLLTRLRLGFGVRPFSYFWGIDRGFPIHRYYLERFLEVCAHDIRGHCLEFQEDSYTSRFGKDRVTRLDILHREEGNPHATLVADLTKPNDIPSNQFDCIICTHVLHIVFELDTILAELYRILKPGGVLLVAVPNVSMCKPEFEEMWRFTPAGLYRLLAKQFGEAQVTVQAYGNSLTAAGEIRGLVAWEFTRAELDFSDPYFPVEVCARAVKREPELRFPPNRAESSSTT